MRHLRRAVGIVPGLALALSVACGGGSSTEEGTSTPDVDGGASSDSGATGADTGTGAEEDGGGDGGTATPDASPPPGPPLPTKLSSAQDSPYVCALQNKGIVCWGNYQAAPEAIGVGSDWAFVAPGYSSISGAGVACALKTDGTLWCWTEKNKAPAQLEAGTFKQIAYTGSSLCAVDANGKLLCRGSNNTGILGLGDTNPRATFTQVGTDTDWARVELAEGSACALKTTGALFCWGKNYRSRLAPNAPDPITAPMEIAAGTMFTDIAVGNGNECAVRSDKQLLCWGDGNVPGLTSATPTPIDAATDWEQVRLGYMHACARKTNGTLFCRGNNFQGQVGNGTLVATSTMTQVGTATDWFDLTAGGSTTCAVHVDGKVACWGDGTGGQLGRAPVTPTQIGAAGAWNDVVARGDLTCALKTTGELHCWGATGYVGLAAGPELAFATPQKLGTGTWAGVAVSTNDVFVWPAAGALSSAGVNASGMDGVNKLGAINTLTSTGFAAAQVAAGGQHACGFAAGGALSCWGRPNEGQLGFTSASNVLVPTASGNATYKALTASRASTCGLRTDGTLWCWGRTWGATPVQVSADTGWTSVGSSLYDDVFFGISAGSLFAWKAGDTSVANVSQNATWKSYAADSYYSAQLGLHWCGVHGDGSLWCGGWNTAGEVGDGTTVSRDTGVPIGNATDWTKVVAGISHVCGLRGATLYCWGGNASGQVGDGYGFAKLPLPLP